MGGWVPRSHPLAATAQPTAVTVVGTVVVGSVVVLGSPGGIQVFDANNDVLGKFAGLDEMKGVVVFKNGFFIPLLFNGRFASWGITWTGPNCTGTPSMSLFGSGPHTAAGNTIVYSAQANTFYAVGGPGASGFGVEVARRSVEGVDDDGTSRCFTWDYVGSDDGWSLTPIDVGIALGWAVTGSPARVAGPIKFQ
jgi:hypothetical protein